MTTRTMMMIPLDDGKIIPVYPFIYRVEVPMNDGHADRVDRWVFAADTLMTAYTATEDYEKWSRHFDQQHEKVQEIREKARQSLEHSSARCKECADC